MRTNFLTKFYDPSLAATAGGLNPVTAGLGALQGALGIVQTISGKSQMKKLMAQRTAYKTPEEYVKILQATQSAAQQGYDAVTLNYLTNQIDRGFDSAAGAATRLGANPNDLSALFDQKMQGIMKVGAENHALNMQNFSRYLGALDVIGQNKAAEWKSQQDIIKDKMQAAGTEMQAGVQNIGSAANAFIAADSASRTSNLYTNDIFKRLADALKGTGGLNSAALGSMDRMALADVKTGSSPAGAFAL